MSTQRNTVHHNSKEHPLTRTSTPGGFNTPLRYWVLMGGVRQVGGSILLHLSLPTPNTFRRDLWAHKHFSHERDLHRHLCGKREEGHRGFDCIVRLTLGVSLPSRLVGLTNDQSNEKSHPTRTERAGGLKAVFSPAVC